jgi:hypothetical protein
MVLHTSFLSQNVIEVSSVPKDVNGVATTGDYYSLKGASGIVFIISQGAWAGGTPAVTLSQATDVAATGAKALSFTEKWSKVALTGTLWVKSTVVSDTFNLIVTANSIAAVEISAAQLDRDNLFDCVSLNIASPGANADLLQVTAILYGLRDQGDPATILYNPKVD